VYFGVWVKDATSTTTSFDANASMLYTVTACSPPTIAASPTTVQAGVHSTLTSSTTCGHASPLYEFWLRTSTSDWFLARSYSTLATYDWNSTGAPAGTIYFGLWVKDASSTTSTFDDNASTTVTVTPPPPPCNVPAVTAAPTTVVHGSGTHVIVTVSTTCTSPNPNFQFWLRTTNTDWQLVQSYSTAATYDWNSTGAPVTTVYIGVWVKDSASTTTSFDNNNSVAIPVT
jgi:nicotinamide mononucleotide (NMN) deamidase PncC